MSKRMYEENVRSLNWFVGCRHGCAYCKPSFQAQMKRQRKNCEKCYRYHPHAHLERLKRTPPKTGLNGFIFFPSSADPCFSTHVEFRRALLYTQRHITRRFLIQSKDPQFFLDYDIPSNVILGTTIETDKIWFEGSPSKYRAYSKISSAPFPIHRFDAMMRLKHELTEVTIEPILDFDSEILSKWIRAIDPKFCYVGYDNHNCKLPEPALSKTQKLIEELKKFTEVRVKSLRKAWYEK